MEYTGERLIVGRGGPDKESDIYREHMERYRFAAELIEAGSKVLDIAAGTGYGAKIIAQSGASEVWGGDISLEAIEAAKEAYGDERVHFRVMEAENIPFDDNYFDMVVSLETVEHLDNYINFILELKRVLKPGGRLIISTPDRRITKQLGIDNPFHTKEFSLREMVDLVQGDFGELAMYGQRPLARLSVRQKLLKKMYRAYARFQWLGWLKRVISISSRQRIGAEIEGLAKDFKVRQREPGRDYLYILLVARKI